MSFVLKYNIYIKVQLLTLIFWGCAPSAPETNSYQADVIVYGGTSAGVIAAVEVAQSGKSSWKGEIDTIMTPMDSIRYYKHFLRAAMMSMEPQTGHVKAWVGGFNYKHFLYDHDWHGYRIHQELPYIL